MKQVFSRNLRRSRAMVEQAAHLNENDDIIVRPFRAMGLEGVLYYVDGMAGGQQIAEYILRPLQHATETLSGDQALSAARERLIEISELTEETALLPAIRQMMQGQCLVLLDTCNAALLADVRSYVRRSVSTPQTENVIIGPHEAFTESLRDNLTLLHRLLPTANLHCRTLTVGTHIPVQVTVCFLKGVCPDETVQELFRRIGLCRADSVLTLSMLSQLIEDDPYAPLPQTILTERPDRVASFLLEGQAAVLMDGSPYGLCMPMGLWHLLHAPDDTYMRWQYGFFMRLVRMAGLALALLLPGVFLSLVLFHPVVLPMSLLTNIIQSRSVVSISLFAEALLMILVFDLINEASARIPGLMGSSFGLVSALILGTAAVDAGLVSPLLLIVVALSGLGSYALPSYPLSFAVRIGQLLLTIAGGVMGLPGVCLGLVCLITRMAGLQSLGSPYLAPVSPHRAHNPDLVWRGPLFRQRLRTWLANPSAMLRLHGPMRFEKGNPHDR